MLEREINFYKTKTKGSIKTAHVQNRFLNFNSPIDHAILQPCPISSISCHLTTLEKAVAGTLA